MCNDTSTNARNNLRLAGVKPRIQLEQVVPVLREPQVVERLGVVIHAHPAAGAGTPVGVANGVTGTAVGVTAGVIGTGAAVGVAVAAAEGVAVGAAAGGGGGGEGGEEGVPRRRGEASCAVCVRVRVPA